MKFPGNCLLVALIACATGRGRLRHMRNRSNRVHFYWITRSGEAWEFYTKGASRSSYLRNLLRLGEVRRAPALDELQPVAIFPTSAD